MEVSPGSKRSAKPPPSHAITMHLCKKAVLKNSTKKAGFSNIRRARVGLSPTGRKFVKHSVEHQAGPKWFEVLPRDANEAWVTPIAEKYMSKATNPSAKDFIAWVYRSYHCPTEDPAEDQDLCSTLKTTFDKFSSSKASATAPSAPASVPANTNSLIVMTPAELQALLSAVKPSNTTTYQSGAFAPGAFTFSSGAFAAGSNNKFG